jgi:hypothetical protein
MILFIVTVFRISIPIKYFEISVFNFYVSAIDRYLPAKLRGVTFRKIVIFRIEGTGYKDVDWIHVA